MKGGYCGTLLAVDLSAGTVRKRALPPEPVLRKYIGGAGLGFGAHGSVWPGSGGPA